MADVDIRDLVVHSLLLLGLDPHMLAQQDQRFRYFSELHINPHMFDAANPQALELCLGFLLLCLGGVHMEEHVNTILQQSFPTYRDPGLTRAFREAVMSAIKRLPVDEHNAKFAITNAQGDRAWALLLQLSRYVMSVCTGGTYKPIADKQSPAVCNVLRALIHKERLRFEKQARSTLVTQKQMQEFADRLIILYRASAPQQATFERSVSYCFYTY
eukprot:TRINITY_DN5491_c0_g1_i4.p1 TRINITY_DN5491_c0_g1~~TRINITY_DN5491_c0_g1_i4.p1  ORF type:complete len:225 (-),score=26.30 TRINITY_DN5491_c0_g1_i4:526-1170(-)